MVQKGASVDSRSDIRIDLTLVEEGSRRLESAPDDVRIGAVCLKGWQVDPIEIPANMFDGYDGYLVKINYDLELDPGLPWMSWFEVAFDLGSDNSDHVTVIDALPRSGTTTDVPTSFVLNRYLNLVPCENGATAHAYLPASTDTVIVFGIGSRRVQWRHAASGTTGVRPGSYAAWIVVLVPTGRIEQHVGFSARYGLEVGTDVDYLPTQSPAHFLLPFAEPSGPAGVLSPSLAVDDARQAEEYHPRVFISYAHDTNAHKNWVRRLGDLLVTCGVDAHLDQWDSNHRKEWSLWAAEQFEYADFVIAVVSPTFLSAFDGKLADGAPHRGIKSETVIIREKLHSNRDEWTRKVLPVVPPYGSVDDISVQLQRWTADHYAIDKLSPEGIDELLRAMTGVPRHVRPPLGQLPPSVRKPLSGAAES